MDPTWDRNVRFLTLAEVSTGFRSIFNKLSMQEFLFIAYRSDFLEVEIKDKFAKSRPTITRNLGKLKIAISQLLDNVKPQ